MVYCTEGDRLNALWIDATYSRRLDKGYALRVLDAGQARLRGAGIPGRRGLLPHSADPTSVVELGARMLKREPKVSPVKVARSDSEGVLRAHPQPSESGALGVISAMLRTANAVRRHMEHEILADHDLSWGAFAVMCALWNHGELETQELAAEVSVAKGTLTGVLKTLESRGWAKREQHAGDKRRVVVHLMPAGHRVMKTLFPRYCKEAVLVTLYLREVVVDLDAVALLQLPGGDAVARTKAVSAALRWRTIVGDAAEQGLARSVMDEEEDVEPVERDRVGREEVAGHDTRLYATRRG